MHCFSVLRHIAPGQDIWTSYSTMAGYNAFKLMVIMLILIQVSQESAIVNKVN
jgi:hypothetical protein